MILPDSSCSNQVITYETTNPNSALRDEEPAILIESTPATNSAAQFIVNNKRASDLI